MTTLKYPSGALLRISDIVRHKDRPGLLPIDRSTWHRWIKAGKVPDGHRIAGTSTKVWPIEVVRGLGLPSSPQPDNLGT